VGFEVESVDKAVLARKALLAMPVINHSHVRLRLRPVCTPISALDKLYKTLCSFPYLSFSPIENPHLSLFVQNHAYSHRMFSSLLFQKQRPSRGCLFLPGGIALFSKTKPIRRMWENQMNFHVAFHVPSSSGAPKCTTRRSDDVLAPVPKAHLYPGMSSFVWRLCYICKNQRRPMDVGESKDSIYGDICSFHL
jgi:hypothetical protein